jgi:N-acetylglucosamine kinase-like BadF-type ATPase
MTKYIIGVDGGGTKTHCALFDIDGNKIDLVEWGPTNHEGLSGGFTELKVELDNMLSHILSKNNLSKDHIVNYVLGLAGVDTIAQYHIISDILRELGCKNFTLCNDAYLGVKAGCRSGVGICAINGTGCTVVGIDSKGGMLQVGGQGGLTGDIGGGGYLGYKVVSTVYNALFKKDVPTIMKDIMFTTLNIKSKHEYMEVLTEKVNNRQIKIKDLCKIVFDAANQGDAAALNILKEMGHENAKSINGIIHELSFSTTEPIQVVLAGSVYVKGKNATAIDTIKQEIAQWNPERQVNFRVLNEPPVMGAVLWALENHKTYEDLFEKVLRQFN